MLQELFEDIGGKFISTIEDINTKNNQIKAYLFDWDGVFNNGEKSGNEGSPFNEADSMGTNLLRFSYWLKNDNLPIVGILSGEKNQNALKWSNRESIHSTPSDQSPRRREYARRLQNLFRARRH